MVASGASRPDECAYSSPENQMNQHIHLARKSVINARPVTCDAIGADAIQVAGTVIIAASDHARQPTRGSEPPTSASHGPSLRCRMSNSMRPWQFAKPEASQPDADPGRSTRAVAIAAAPSPRPVSPSPSVVVADKLTEAPPKAEARTAWASSRRGAIRGRWLMIWTDTLPITQSASARSSTVRPSSTAPEAPAHSPARTELTAKIAQSSRRKQR